MIVVVGGIKGGTGKSTIAINLAVLRSQSGSKVLLIDADMQKSTVNWADERKKQSEICQFDTLSIIGRELSNHLTKLKNQYDDIIIDTGGRDSDSQRAALLHADQFLVPFRPRSFDMWTIHSIKRIVTEFKPLNKALKTFVFINQGETRGNDNEASIGMLSCWDEFKCLPCTVSNRKSFSKSIDDGLAVIELEKKDDKANDEIVNLYEHVYRF